LFDELGALKGLGRFWRLPFDPNGAGQLEDYQRTHAPGHSIEELCLRWRRERRAEIAWRGRATDHGGAVRGVLERGAASHRHLVRGVVGAGTSSRVVRSVAATGGGARSPLWLQMNADILGVPVVTPSCPERACLGAAASAAVAVGCSRQFPMRRRRWFSSSACSSRTGGGGALSRFGAVSGGRGRFRAARHVKNRPSGADPRIAFRMIEQGREMREIVDRRAAHECLARSESHWGRGILMGKVAAG